MTYIHPAALEYERKRWLRADAHRFIHAGWRRFVKPGSDLAALYEGFERKYRPDQPRVPPGHPEGGQWTSEAGGGQTDSPRPSASPFVQSILDKAKQIAAGGRSKSYLRCLDLCSPILERFQPPGVDINEWEFRRCMAACLGKR